MLMFIKKICSSIFYQELCRKERVPVKMQLLGNHRHRQYLISTSSRPCISARLGVLSCLQNILDKNAVSYNMIGLTSQP